MFEERITHAHLEHQVSFYKPIVLVNWLNSEEQHSPQYRLEKQSK
jgi:hypothetical protein